MGEPRDEAETVVDRPARAASVAETRVLSAPGESGATSISPEPTAASAAETLLQAELDQLQVAGKMFVPILVAGIAAVWFLVDGHPIVELIYIGALVAWFPVYFALMWLSRRPERYLRHAGLLPWIAVAVIVAINQVYWGPFSAGVIVAAVALATVSRSYSLRTAVTSYVIIALGQLVPAIWMIAGYPDLGVLPADHLPPETLVLLAVLLQALLFLLFAFGRTTRRSLLRRTEEQQRAVRRLGQREAVLAEARADFERALGRGADGAFTGQTLGSFRLGPVIGRGAMGEVYEATDDTGGLAAVKVLHRGRLGDPDTTRRFLREIELASRIVDDHVVKVIEIGVAGAPIPYIAMERLHGESLSDHLRRELRLSPGRTVELVRQCASGLSAAHAAGIIHRDIKPQNLFLARAAAGETRWKILDFGVGKLIGAGDSLTQDRLVGTPQYMAPEQANAETVDARADVYGLAAVAYRALTGHPPFASDDLAAVIFQVVLEMPRRPRSLASLDQAVEDVLLIGLTKDPADRFQTPRELADALAAAVDGSLPADLRQRVRDLTGRRPWGSSEV